MFILKVSGVGGGLCPVGYALIFCGIAQKWAYFCVNLKLDFVHFWSGPHPEDAFVCNELKRIIER